MAKIAHNSNEWARRWGPLIAAAGVVAAIAVPAASVLFEDDAASVSARSDAGLPSAAGAAANGLGDFASAHGWFDASGNRQAIEYVDSNTPWLDRAGFNFLIGTFYGDERAFVDARLADATEPGSYKNDLAVKAGDTIVVRVYVHNVADPATRSSPGNRGRAVNTRVRVVSDDAYAHEQRVIAYVAADNADPEWVADTFTVRSDSAFVLEAVPGSARVYTNQVPNGILIADSVWSTGSPFERGPSALIGLTEANGEIEALGSEAEAVVQLSLKVVSE